jgi:hypothetical protein
MKFKKGSKEAKEYMASIRGMKKNVNSIGSLPFTGKFLGVAIKVENEGNDIIIDVGSRRFKYIKGDSTTILSQNIADVIIKNQKEFQVLIQSDKNKILSKVKNFVSTLKNEFKKSSMKKSAPKKKALKKAAPKKAAPKKAVSIKQTGTSNKDRDLQRAAKLPGRRKSPSGGFYYETRRNRSDAPGSLLGIGSISLNQIGAELYEMEAKINMLKFRKKEARTMTEKKELQSRINILNTQFKALRSYLNSRAKFK